VKIDKHIAKLWAKAWCLVLNTHYPYTVMQCMQYFFSPINNDFTDFSNIWVLDVKNVQFTLLLARETFRLHTYPHCKHNVLSPVTWCRPYSIRPIVCNMTSSTKLEVHNILHWCQRKTKPQPQTTCMENFANSGHVVFERSVQACTETYRHADCNTLYPSYCLKYHKNSNMHTCTIHF